MTTFLDEVSNNILNKFSIYLKDNNITLTEAAEILSISKGQLSHLMKFERSLNHLIGRRMLDMMKGKRPDSNGGIYGIYYNDKIIYIGQTVNFKNRWYAHKSAIKNNIQDKQPFHQCGLNVEFLSYKILFDKTKLKLFPSEINKIENIFITNILPEWNTVLNSIHQYNLTNKEKVQKIFEYYYTWQKNTLEELDESYLIGVTEEGNKELIKTLNYTEQEVLQRAISIVKNSKQFTTSSETLDISLEEITNRIKEKERK